METIEDVVRNHIMFTHRESSKGWNNVYCEVCGDGTHSKGQRGGWLFQGDICFYNCFNCGIDGNFDPNRDVPHSKKMWDIFRAFNIPVNEVNSILASKLSDEKKSVLKRRERIHFSKIKPPDFFKLLTEFPEDDVFAEEARNYLWGKYRITPDDYPFYLSTGKTMSENKDDIYLSRALRPRIIIPALNNGNIIYWQARVFIGEHYKKYISATVEDSSAILFGVDNIHSGNQELPLYVTEGFFDSWHVNGVAVLTNTMKDIKVTLLDRSRRPKVVIPDYNKDGMNLANQAIDVGWGISLPNTLPCGDLCNAIIHFGKLYVIKSIVDNTFYGFEAKLRLKDFMLKNNNFLQ
jgi:hypothetical protein